jgi:hypothetical protein
MTTIFVIIQSTAKTETTTTITEATTTITATETTTFKYESMRNSETSRYGANTKATMCTRTTSAAGKTAMSSY